MVHLNKELFILQKTIGLATGNRTKHEDHAIFERNGTSHLYVIQTGIQIKYFVTKVMTFKRTSMNQRFLM
jgi:hypothetical protein